MCSPVKSKQMEGEDVPHSGQGAHPQPKILYLRLRRHSRAWKALLNLRMLGKGLGGGVGSSMGENPQERCQGFASQARVSPSNPSILTFRGGTKPNPRTAPIRHHSSSLSSSQNYDLNFLGEGTYD